jgi:spore coat protein U-like protein
MNWGVPDRCTLMQRLMRRLCALVALALASLLAQPVAAQVVTASAGAQASIVEPLSLLKLQDLDFGRMAARPTAGTVTVNPNTGACTVTGPILHTGGCQFAEFGGQGVRRMRVRIQLPATITLTGPGGATMTANTLTLGLAPDLTQLPGSPGNPRYEIGSNSGIFTFRVGARLNVGANQAPGVYNGTFNVTVIYQ